MDWKVIEQNNNYKISSEGDVKSIKTGRILSPYDTGHGYLVVSLSKDGVAKNYYIHRLVAHHFVDNPNSNNVVNHLNEIKDDNRHSNLEWTTAKGNTRWSSSISIEDAESIRDIYANTDKTIGDIADEFGISESNCENIIENISWYDEEEKYKLSNSEIIEKIHNDPKYHKSVREICWHQDLVDDLYQDMLAVLMERPNKMLNRMISEGKMIRYFRRMCKLESQSKTSRFYYKYRRYSDNKSFDDNYVWRGRSLTGSEYVRAEYPDRIHKDARITPYEQLYDVDSICYEEDFYDIITKCTEKVLSRYDREWNKTFRNYQNSSGFDYDKHPNRSKSLNYSKVAKDMNISKQAVRERIMNIRGQIKYEIDKYLSEDH